MFYATGVVFSAIWPVDLAPSHLFTFALQTCPNPGVATAAAEHTQGGWQADTTYVCSVTEESHPHIHVWLNMAEGHTQQHQPQVANSDTDTLTGLRLQCQDVSLMQAHGSLNMERY